MRLFFVSTLYLLLLSTASCSQVVLHNRTDLQEAAKKLSPEERTRDYRIVGDFRQALEQLEPRFRQTNYDLLVFRGVVVFFGRAFDEDMQMLPAQAAQRVNGVRQFFNYVTVGPPLGLLEKTDDISANARFRSALLTYANIDVSIVESTVFENRLYLMGYTTKQQALTIVELAQQIEGVEVVRVFFEYVHPNGMPIKAHNASREAKSNLYNP